MSSDYAELHCLSNFSFLRGASHPHELVETAKAQGYRALALTDECSLAGVVQAHVHAQEHGLPLIIGTELNLEPDFKLVLLAPDRQAYSQLCQLISKGRRRADKGEYRLDITDLENSSCNHCLAIWLPLNDKQQQTQVQWLKQHFHARIWIGLSLHREPSDAERLTQLRGLSNAHQLPLVACGDVHMHQRHRRILQDTITAIRHGCTLETAGIRLFPNGERHLRDRRVLQALYPADLLAESVKLAKRCHFSLDQLDYRYPAEVPAGTDPNIHLEKLTLRGLKQRYPDGTPEAVKKLIAKELKVIRELDCPQYFLTVHEIMRWARGQGILCQGRGSAGNSAVCFALGVTEVNPAKQATLFERFLSAERREPPDIDVDFEHERREEVFQHIYQKYGRSRAALAATVIRYRPKSAIRDVGKALGFSLQDITRINQSLAWWDQHHELANKLHELGFDPQSHRVQRLFDLVGQIIGMPRHLSQHVGGFVICEKTLSELVPIENAAMDERTVIQWEKRDLEAIGLFKVDCLALGMLTAIRKSLDLIRLHGGPSLSISKILKTEEDNTPEAAAVFQMLGRAQSVGVFQIESRAQMSMLPRMKPMSLYDLTVETAIVRPGPIQGGMVHPYLERREKARLQPDSPIDCPAALQGILGRTYGIPIFQEQVMEVCVKGAGFEPGEANQVRRSMAAWGRSGYGKLQAFEERLKNGFRNNGFSEEFAQRIFQQIQGFSEYGFPESHAAAFAALAYVSAWLKRFHPAAFLCGLLNSQPMGFYSPSQLIQDFKRLHAVKVLPPDVSYSQWDHSLELESQNKLALRLGLRQIKGLSESSGRRIAAGQYPANSQALFQHCELGQKEREALANADALRSLSGNRHQAHWAAQGFLLANDPVSHAEYDEDAAELSPLGEDGNIQADYLSLGLSLRRHPVALLRPQLKTMGVLSAYQWWGLSHGRHCQVAGMITNRQRPGTAKGIIFMTLEDESGTVNLVIRQKVLERFRHEVLQAPFLIVQGKMENRKDVRHLMVEGLINISHWMRHISFKSRNFH